MITDQLISRTRKILNTHASRNKASKYIKQQRIKLQGETGKLTIKAECFDASLSVTDRRNRQKIIEDTEDINNTINKIDLIDIYRTFHTTTTDYISFQSAHKTFIRKDNILDYQISLNKFLKIQVIETLFSDHNGAQLKISKKKMPEKSLNIWRLNNTLQNNPRVKEEIKR